MRIRLFLCAVLAACGDSGVPFEEARDEIARAFCDRCRPDDPACFADAVESLSPLPGQPKPGDADPDLLAECVEGIAAFPTCDGYEMPDACRRMFR